MNQPALKKAPQKRPELNYWPYCERCRQPYEFDPDEPFAYCGCPGASEYGGPRPASWIPKPEPGVYEGGVR